MKVSRYRFEMAYDGMHHMMSNDFFERTSCFVTSGTPSHAGGPRNKKKIAADSASQSTTGAAEAVGTTTASSEDDGDGDGDPDSDRRKKICSSKSLSPALVQRAIPNRILRMPELKVRIGLSRSTIYEAISKGEFPPSISLGARAVGWLESDVDAWVQSRVSASKAL